MSVQQYTDPVILDSTGLSIVQKLDQIKDAVQPTNPCLDIDITIPASGWSSTAPYTYTYSNAHITTGCAVEVNYLESENADTVLYLEYEKVNGGVRFEAPTKPSAGIPVRIHIMNADATSVLSITADEVSTDAVSGTSNVEDALSSLSDHIGMLDPITITDRTKSPYSLLSSVWTSSIPDDNSVHFIVLQAQYGDCFGFISRYGSYGTAILMRYDGKVYYEFLNNGSVTEKQPTFA